MSTKRTYKVDEIYYLCTYGFLFTMERNMKIWSGRNTNRKIVLLANDKSLAVKYKGISTAKKHQVTLILASLGDDKQEMMGFLKMDNQKIHLQNTENIYLEVEFFDEQEQQKIIEQEQQKSKRNYSDPYLF